ncbi:L-ascorbate metabolism protein UlaG, beta-lactamase superfamily [Rathayibacter oskolensis]|uniref:L-ascorbate metabolism protein UlaG, beta-lactamase superfamily n=1 Tax=Rathayibacter oskolensis TaxID=1891671 RepID=A0A1X7NWY2_9MICO|nr:MBL fold metallo-hydrolase [Rathayibacter oskolensis]SMH42862.1 L-ascorbate metabolism protein UlaG, beta-lactamase superfamily [Rathayibacter oskolensis]
MQITRIGGPTLLVELDGWRILIDPTFDPPGQRYDFGLGTSSVKTLGPALPLEALGPLDVVLVSHDHHADNLDTAGRAALPRATHVITTTSGARRLDLAHARGLAAGETTSIESPGKGALRITATPCRHGPPLSGPLVGDVIGFALRLQGRGHHDLWVTGDTVLHRNLLQTARRLDVDVAIVNAGGVRFGLTGPIRYSMTGADAVGLVTALRPRVAIPAHYDGWSHFRDGEGGMRAAIRRAPADVRERFRWLPDGRSVDLSTPPHSSPPSERTRP